MADSNQAMGGNHLFTVLTHTLGEMHLHSQLVFFPWVRCRLSRTQGAELRVHTIDIYKLQGLTCPLSHMRAPL
jgi:hypothetical protein